MNKIIAWLKGDEGQRFLAFGVKLWLWIFCVVGTGVGLYLIHPLLLVGVIVTGLLVVLTLAIWSDVEGNSDVEDNVD